MLLYTTITNEHKKQVKIGGNTAIKLTAHIKNKIVGEVVLLEGSLALYNTKGELKGEIQIGKKQQDKKESLSCLAQVGEELCGNKAYKDEYCLKHHKMFS